MLRSFKQRMVQRREQSHLRASTSEGGAEGGEEETHVAEKEETRDMEELYARPPPLLRDVSAAERENLVHRKLKMCRKSFDFADATAQPREKELKRQTLLEMVDVVNGTYGKLGEGMYQEVVQTIAANLFRALPPTGGEDGNGMDGDEDEPTLEPAWSHLQIVYEMLLRFVVSTDTDTKVAKEYINGEFIVHLLELFDSEDPRERDYLKTVLHRVYGKFMVHRPFIRKAINNIFFRFLYETERHNGIAELLEILGSIINGFALPLKEEHKVFLVKALLPLHKPKCMAFYQPQLSYCVTQFVEKDPTLAEPVLRAILKYWPLTNSQKEVIFIGELEEVLELTQFEEFSKVLVPLFHQIARCINSPHFQVAERSLYLWNNDYIVGLIAQNRHVVLPLVFGALEKNARSHWNLTVHNLTCNVRKMFMEMDSSLYAECQKKFEEEEEQESVRSEQRLRKWREIEEKATSQIHKEN